MAKHVIKRRVGAGKPGGGLRAALVLAALAAVLVTAYAITAALGHIVPVTAGRRFLPMIILSPVVAAYFAYASLKKSRELHEGGAELALLLGGAALESARADMLERRLLAVVEQQARALDLSAPQVFILRQEAGINAFVAGWSADDAVLAITQGALQRLNREELQAVVSHELSQVLSGDMAVNMRATIWLEGLFALSGGAKLLLAQRRERSGVGRFAAPVAGALLAVLGIPAALIGRVLQAAVARRRELQIDAASVAHTGDAGALKRVLLKIAGSSQGSRVAAPAATDIAHMFFARGDSGWFARLGGMFATHPSLAQRLKALDPHFDASRMASLSAEAGKAADELALNYLKERKAPGSTNAGPAQGAAFSAPMAAAAGAANAPGTGNGNLLRFLAPDAAVAELSGAATELLTLDTLQRRWSVPAQKAYNTVLNHYRGAPTEVLALVIAVLLPQDLETRRPLLQQVARVSGGRVLPVIAAACNLVQKIPEQGRSSAVLALAPEVAALAGQQRSQLTSIARYLCTNSEGPQLQRYAVQYLLRQGITPPESGAGDAALKLTDCTAEIGVLFQVLTVAGQRDATQARRAFDAGLQSLIPPTLRPKFAVPGADWDQALDAALLRLRGLHPVARKSLGLALARAISHDGKLSVAEADLLRLACLVIGMPLPALSSGDGAAADHAGLG